MADTKITNMTAASTLGGTEVVAGVQSGGNVKITIDQIDSYISGGTSIILPTKGGTGIANNASSTITISGSFATTLTVTATTGITLPTTGTLATLAGSETLTNKTLTSPILTTPTLGVATATSVNKITITAPASSATLTLADSSSLITSGGNSITLTSSGSTNITLPTSGTLVTLAGSEELTNKTLNASVGKGTWTASGTWTLPAHTLGGTVSGGGQQLNNIIIGTTTPLAGSFTTLTASSTVTAAAANGFYLAANQALYQNGNYTTLLNSAGNSVIALGNASDKTNYYYNDSHTYYNVAQSVLYGTINASGMSILTGTALTSGGSTTMRFLASSGSLGIYFGSGAPTISAAQGSLYIRSDGSSTITRGYINTNGSTTWTPITTVG